MRKFKIIITLIRTVGIKGLMFKLINKVLNKPERMKDLDAIAVFFIGKKGLEIGGPSNLFNRQGFMPIYDKMTSLDNINFSSSTIWTGIIDEQSGFVINNKAVGKVYITDTIDLTLLKNHSYDFILSCNNIEHIANPLKAVKQWISILKNEGILVVVAPRKESNFDHKRKIVKFSHILDDYKSDIGEDDLTHLDEILMLHDLSMDKPAGTKEQFRERSLKNFENRCLHHHVFDLEVLNKIFHFFNLSIIKTYELYTDYIIIGRKN